MRQTTGRIVAALGLCLGPVMGGELSLVPVPATVAPGEGAFQLVPQTMIVADEPIAELLRDNLATATGYPLKAANTAGENAIQMAADAGLVDQLGKEGYKLSVTRKGVALRAATGAGIFYGIQTLRQLLPPEIYRDEKVEGVAWTIPCVEITDRPRFGWRGMHLDVARHYMPPEFIRRFIDLIAMHKMNRFHLHLTDDQAWRIEIRKFPELTAKGSSGSKSGDYGKPMFYTQEEMRAIVAYAAERHIVVIPEIDIPGHSKAAVAVHREWGSRSLNLQENTIEAYQHIFTELMTIFPGPYIHVGGDEVGASWLKNEADLKVVEAHGLPKRADKIQEWLQGRIVEPILAAKRRPVMWFMDQSWLDEKRKKGKQAEGKEYPISKDTIVMGWFDHGRSMRAAQAGYDVVMNPMLGTYFDYRTQRDSPIGQGRVNTLDDVYGFDPLAGVTDEKTARHILGTQGQLWSESMTDPAIVESKSFPRTCALAEVAWTPQDLRDYAQFTGRMKTHYRRLDALKVNYYKLKTPMTVIATETLDKTGQVTKFEWDISRHLTGAGAYRIMFDTWRFTHLIEVKGVQLTCNGKPVFTSDRVANTTKAEGGKSTGAYDIELPEYDSNGTYVLKTEITRIGKGKSWDMDLCIRKNTSPKKGN